MLSTSLFDYDLPEELIAQHPAGRRDGSRMLVLDRASGACEIRPFGAIREYLSAGDALIYNDTRVLRGRVYARKTATLPARNSNCCSFRRLIPNGGSGTRF